MLSRRTYQLILAAALGLMSVLTGQRSGSQDHLAGWPGNSAARRKLLVP
jgi:hypothetical protein